MSDSAVEKEFTLEIGDREGTITGLLSRPSRPAAAYVFAHGAGAGMRHSFMETVARLLTDRAIAVIRYQFPYMEAGRRAPNPPRVLIETVRRALEFAAQEHRDIPLFAGGKSMGGRMTSLCLSEGGLRACRGLVFFGFPLHAPGKPSTGRGNHLRKIDVPMLFVQGSRDKLATLDLLRPVLDALPEKATLLEIDEGDHSLKVPKRTGRTYSEVLEHVADKTVDWINRQI